MTWSLNELEVEVKKAIRGAGLSWGLAEEGSKAVRWLAAHGADPLPALNDILDRHDRGRDITKIFKLAETGRWQAEIPLCPIVLGAALCDNADRLRTTPFVAGPVAQPLLLVPFAARAARLLKHALRLDLNGQEIVLTEGGDPRAALPSIDRPYLPEVRCEMIVGGVPLSQFELASMSGIAVDADRWTRLSAYVHRTYVPASERSRREGAGAGLIDND